MTKQLLPGVTETNVPPVEVFESRRVIASARRWAIVRDLANLLLLGSVDWLFLRWPHAHVPLLDRGMSILVLLLVNGLSIAYMGASRSVPRWRARRVAHSWTESERDRLINYLKY